MHQRHWIKLTAEQHKEIDLLRYALAKLLAAHWAVADGMGLTEPITGELKNAHDAAVAALQQTKYPNYSVG
jgi:hypothetical protein